MFIAGFNKLWMSLQRFESLLFAWWESRVQQDLLKQGKIISSWFEFVYALKKQLSFRIHAASHYGLTEIKAKQRTRGARLYL